MDRVTSDGSLAERFPTESEWARLSTLALAGGGNRCWWQAGAICRLLEAGWALPRYWVGTSAGAAIAMASLTTGPKVALAACRKLYGETSRVFDWHGLRRGRLRFAHQSVYPAWLDSFVNESSFNELRVGGVSLHVAVTRPSRFLGVKVSVALGTLAYIIDKKSGTAFTQVFPSFWDCARSFVMPCRSLGECFRSAPPFDGNGGAATNHASGSSRRWICL